MATTFFFNGLEQLSRWVQTGYPARPDLVIAVPAWFSNLFIVVGCLWGYLLLPKKSFGDLGKFVVAFALTRDSSRWTWPFSGRAIGGLFPPDVAPALALLRALSGADRLAISLIRQAKGVRFRYSGVSRPAGRSLRWVSCGANYIRDHHGEGFADPRRRTL